MECLQDLTSRPWCACEDCAGTGFDSTGLSILCPDCCGSGLIESTPLHLSVSGGMSAQAQEMYTRALGSLRAQIAAVITTAEKALAVAA
ncbi:hypothetical protein QMK19_14070 [Streptomyces sp. H10-C2]|uniref:hypothetical protein n=1 Tax=unclassified Streptomyces TaxID=2593676 RepID=UPI0024B8A35B|nr:MULTISPECIES: hypothetical protein [unclassified Streptomyces]MDJ0346340.1 hypothetical protein [Streptomyces sp. PH10-H1]MDJ0370777.1 hypothetical protein [Streptomyces sp. H10-C2]